MHDYIHIYERSSVDDMCVDDSKMLSEREKLIGREVSCQKVSEKRRGAVLPQCSETRIIQCRLQMRLRRGRECYQGLR